MDTDAAGNHAAFNQNAGMWRSYGLVYRLLEQGIPVRWAVRADKAGSAEVDFAAGSVRDLRTGTDLGGWNYAGGPFVVDADAAAAATAVIQTWWAQKGNQPNVHVAQAPFSAQTSITLRRPPRIANEAINAGITVAYMNAAGIPDLNGNPWSTTSPNILDESEIAAGALFEQGGSCLKRAFDVFVTPHNSGYAYSLSDPTNLGTRTYSQLDTFVEQGGGWTALCHSILSNENAIAALTRSGTPAVQTLFRTSRPGGQPGGFLTERGFSSITNTGGVWGLQPGAAGLGIGQGVPTAVAPALPGGSVQNWPASGAGAPSYWPQTRRIASFTSAGSEYDQIITGSYHNGSGAGPITYIGGHSFATGPYSTNAEAPYLRAFYNSLLLNGSAVAQLDLQLSRESFAQGSGGQISASIVNTGGSSASGIGTTTLTLQPGFSYVSTSAGPAPTVAGNTLTWASLPDNDGSAPAVTVVLAVDASATQTPGKTQFATLRSSYADMLGGSFSGSFCRDLLIVPAATPRLDKQTQTAGPVHPGDTVTWTLTYGNPGGGALEGAVLEDELPPGFSFVSASSSPAIGAPSVIPGVRQKLRWPLGALAAGSPASATVTVTARAAAPSGGSNETFTNEARLSGSGNGEPLEVSAADTIDVAVTEISLAKSVDKSYLQLPGSLTYTLRPRASGSPELRNVRVLDPLPTGAGTPSAVGQSGSFGAYQAHAAVPGHDESGTPVLDSAFSVSANVVQQGGSVTVTLNLKSSSAVSGVSPGALELSGGSGSCGAPSPASAGVAAGGAGTDFVWTCVLNDLGEYAFSTDAGNGAGTDWPVATSASVLSVAGGGPDLVSWSLGSTSAAVPGETITSGYQGGIFALRGGGSTTANRFSASSNAWFGSTAAPGAIGAGGALTGNGAGTLYALRGGGTRNLYSYSAATGSWTTLANTSTNVADGGSAVFLRVGGVEYVFATFGNGTGFGRYNVAGNSWTARAATPANIKKGGSLATDGTYVYGLRGDGQKSFYRYDPAANSWLARASLPAGVSYGGSLTYLNGYLYALTGNNKTLFYRYDPAANAWTPRAAAPGAVNAGAALTTDGTYLYASQGQKTAFWRYDPVANAWTARASHPAATGSGGSLAYVPALSPKGLFSRINASSSLATDGDTVTFTLVLQSNDPVANVAASALSLSGSGSCASLSGPTLVSADDDITSFADSVSYAWSCTVASAGTPGSLTASASGSAGATVFPAASSMGIIVTPPLTFTVPFGAEAPNPIVNAALLDTDEGSVSSPQVSTPTGLAALNVVKASAPAAGAELEPGDTVTYTINVENTGSAPATAVSLSDAVPAQTSYVGCAGGIGCSEAAGLASWQLGTLDPGETATVTLVVRVREDLPVRATPYEVANTAVASAAELVDPVPSNTVTHPLRVQPTIVKEVSALDAATGDTLVYALRITNPGAAFQADLSDPLPAGTSFAGLEQCAPACSFAEGAVRWDDVTVPAGSSSFSFAVTVTAGGGTSIRNAAVLDPRDPDLPPTPSNEVETEVGPTLELVKLNDPAGLVAEDDTITYTLIASNESAVAATDTRISDPVPAGTEFLDCTTPAGSCSEQAGTVSWEIGQLGIGDTATVSFRVRVGEQQPGIFQIENVASVRSSNAPDPRSSNPVYNPLEVPPLMLTKTADPQTFRRAGDVIGYRYQVTNNSPTVTLAGPVSVSDDKTSVSCPDGDLAPLATVVCTSTYTITSDDVAAEQVTNIALARAGGIDSNEARATVTIEPDPDLTIAKSHSGNFAQGQTGAEYQLVVSNVGDTASSGLVTVADALPDGLSATAISGTGWDCTLATVSCTRADALAVNASYPAITLTVDVASPVEPEVVNVATVSGGGDSNDTNNTALDTTLIDRPDLTIAKSHTGDFTQGQAASYQIIVSNEGSASSVGEVTVTDTLPDGLSATAISGTGWDCTLATLTCSREDALAAGESYPAITLAVTVALPAPASSVTNEADVSGGGDPNPDNNHDDDETTILRADLTVAKSHARDFQQSQVGASYQLVVTNVGSAASSGEVSLTDTLPDGLSATAISGTGWDCTLATLTCTRSDALAAGASYAAVTVTVDVDADAPSQVINQADVSGGGDADSSNNHADDPTEIDPFDGTPNLTIVKSHTGNFTQNQVGAEYQLLISNLGDAATSGAITVSEMPPAGLTVTGISGDGWDCTLATLSCSRSDPDDYLSAGASFPPLTVTVDVAADAAELVTNVATVEGGGDSDPDDNSASDPTLIEQDRFPLDVTVIGPGQVNAGSGTIRDCTPATSVCRDTPARGLTVTLTATPGLNAAFVGWSGDCAGSGSRCQVLMSRARAVTARFVPTYRLLADYSGRGRLDSDIGGISCGVDCTQRYRAGTQVIVTARPAGDWYLARWRGCDQVSGSRCFVTMDGDREIVAVFEPKARLDVQVPDRLVWHEPQDRASIVARAFWLGEPLAGARLTISSSCPGRGTVTVTLRTGSDGRAATVRGERMPNAMRQLDCTITARISYRGVSATETGIVRYIHPLWIRNGSGSYRIDAYGRPGTRFTVHLNGRQVGGVYTIGVDGWRTVRISGSRSGDIVDLKGVDDPGIHSHTIRLR